MDFDVSFSRGDLMVDFLQKYLLPLLHPMERPAAWGRFHTLFFVIGIPTAIICAFLLRKLSKKGERKLFFSTGAVLILSEIFKQLAYTALESAYRFDMIPFQLCSIPMYLCIALAILPEGRLSQAARVFTATFGLMGGFASYIAPGTMCRDILELTLHSFLWHLCLIFIGCYVLFSHNTELKKKDFISAELLYLALCAVALAINILCLNAPTDVNMFYIGPKPSNLPLCREITARFGVAINSVIYISALSLCSFIIYVFEYYLKNIIKPIDKTVRL